MILRIAASLLLLQQTVPAADTAAPDMAAPEPRYFHYQRSISVPHLASGQACAVLDGTVFAHAAKQTLDDLRLYADGREVPFTLTESGALRADDEQAEVRNLGSRGGDIVFDLHMPHRPYTAVQLNLAASNFVATATVSGSNDNEAPILLGRYALFDFSAQHLSRSTSLPLQESTFRNLHIALHMSHNPGGESAGSQRASFAPSIVTGATVPPSREAQTLYTPVLTLSGFTTRGRESVASGHIPAHVPVERVAFRLNPSFSKDFLRTVNITARPDNVQDTAFVETVTGNISHTTLPSSSSGFIADESLAHLRVDSVLGADLRQGATVEIAVENGDDAPLPIQFAQLQMRQRRLCFQADPAYASYTLRYGDEALHAPEYDYARLFRASSSPQTSTLGPEETNPSFRARRDTRPYSERHPELVWLALIAVVATLGTVAMRSAKKRH